ncbi:MAG TPA: hypothetical protein VLT91_05075 [Rhizomicrobium sp.]|nr:hypothetical protein [Rhizomicrobium sp.]
MDKESATHSFMRRHWTDTLFAVAALFVSAISLWVGIRTEDANEKLVAASTWPFVQVLINNATPQGEPRLEFNVTNTGVGPAKIESFEVFWKGRPFRSGKELVTVCCGLKSKGGETLPGATNTTRLLTGTVQGFVLRPGESESFIIYPLTSDTIEIWNALNKARKDITYRICYCSVLDECWRNALASDMSKPGQLRPERVKTCPVPEVAYTQ